MTKSSRRPTHGRATAQDVADLAGVSLTTVSRAFQPNPPVSDKTRALVRMAFARKFKRMHLGRGSGGGGLTGPDTVDQIGGLNQ